MLSRLSLGLLLFSLLAVLLPSRCSAQENPYIVAYDHYMEKPGGLEVEYFSTFGTQRGGNDFHALWLEFEYGATAWWTTEFYLDGQSTFNDSTLFTGFHWENRFRPLKHEHFVNPVIYLVRKHQRSRQDPEGNRGPRRRSRQWRPEFSGPARA